MSSIRLLLADDNPSLLEELVGMLRENYEISGAFANGVSVLKQFTTLSPDLIILDISLGEITGFEVARRLKQAGCIAGIIFLTVHENIDFIRAAFDLGAAGYVFKSRISLDLNNAIELVSRGEKFFPISSPSPS